MVCPEEDNWSCPVIRPLHHTRPRGLAPGQFSAEVAGEIAFRQAEPFPPLVFCAQQATKSHKTNHQKTIYKKNTNTKTKTTKNGVQHEGGAVWETGISAFPLFEHISTQPLGSRRLVELVAKGAEFVAGSPAEPHNAWYDKKNWSFPGRRPLHHTRRRG